MEQIFFGFITWQFLFFCIALGAIVYVVRLGVDFALGQTKKNAKWWREFLLPIFPVLLGQIIALLVTSYPFPEGFTSAGGRWIFGLVAGFSSGIVVRLYKALLSGRALELVGKLKGLMHLNKAEVAKDESEQDESTKDQ